MTIEQKVRGLCRVLLAAQNDEAALRIMQRLSEAFDELRRKKLGQMGDGKDFAATSRTRVSQYRVSCSMKYFEI